MKIYVVLLGILPLIGACASGVTRDDRAVASLSGVEMYERLCSSCHGVDGKGRGPVAALMKSGVPDLTRLAWRDGGEFPTEDVHRTIDGRYERPAHGPRDMPVWGWRFYRSADSNDQEERARVDVTIARLVEYLRSIQAE
jgi:mono/diheme cytochrome c family protein